MTALQTALLAIGVALAAASLALMVWQKFPAELAAFAALVTLHASARISLPVGTFLFWGAATLITLAIGWLSPKGAPPQVTRGNPYLAVGAVAGMLIGMSVDASIMVLSAAAGAVFGQLVYTRAPSGRWIKFPSSDFIRYFCARGLKIIVAAAMIGIAVQGFIRNMTV